MSKSSKIVKFFNYPEYARNHSHEGYKDKAQALFGVDRDNNLYFRGTISGYSYKQDWVQLGGGIAAIPFTLKEMKKIVNVLGGNHLEKATKEAQALLNAAFQQELDELRD